MHIEVREYWKRRSTAETGYRISLVTRSHNFAVTYAAEATDVDRKIEQELGEDSFALEQRWIHIGDVAS